MDIREALQTLPHDLQWLDKYLQFLSSAPSPGPDEVFDRHHILPRSLFPEFISFYSNPWNRMDLRPGDHITAHYYLMRAFPGEPTMRYAFKLMARLCHLRCGGSLTKDLVAAYQAARAERERWVNNGEYEVKVPTSQIEDYLSRGYVLGRTTFLSEESKERLRQGNLSRHAKERRKEDPYSYIPRGENHYAHIYGISEATKAKISKTMTGRKLSPETIAKLKFKLIGRRWSWCPEAKQKKSAEMKGVRPNMSFKGGHHTKEFKERRREQTKALYESNPEHPFFTNKPRGEDHWTYGKERDAETRSKISESLTGLKQSAETKKKRSEAMALTRFPKYTEEEIALFEATLVNPKTPCKISALSCAARTVVYGLRLLVKGEATKANRRYWRQADTWMKVSGKS